MAIIAMIIAIIAISIAIMAIISASSIAILAIYYLPFNGNLALPFWQLSLPCMAIITAIIICL